MSMFRKQIDRSSFFWANSFLFEKKIKYLREGRYLDALEGNI